MLGDIGEVVVGLALLIWGAPTDSFTVLRRMARNLGVAPLMIGLTVVSFATSAPEILVSVVAALRGESGLAVGNAIGSNIANIGLVLGTVALIRPIELKSATLRREMPALLAVSLLTVALFLDSALNRIDGFVLLTGPRHRHYLAGAPWIAVVRHGPVASRLRCRDSTKNMEDVGWPSCGWLLASQRCLIGAELLVDGAISIAREIGRLRGRYRHYARCARPTSLPELAVSAVSAIKGEYGLAIGNIVGSNIFNLLAVIGVAAAIQPAILPPTVLSLHIFVMVAFTLVLFAMTYEYDGRGAISRFEGMMLVSAYLAFTAYVVLQNVRIGD